jgi:hypothetical protein
MRWPKSRRYILRNKLSLWLKVSKEKSRALEDLQQERLELLRQRGKWNSKTILLALHNTNNKVKGNQERIARRTNSCSLQRIESLKSFKTPKNLITLSKTGKTDQSQWERERQSSLVGLQIKGNPSPTTTLPLQ